MNDQVVDAVSQERERRVRGESVIRIIVFFNIVFCIFCFVFVLMF